MTAETVTLVMQIKIDLDRVDEGDMSKKRGIKTDSKKRKGNTVFHGMRKWFVPFNPTSQLRARIPFRLECTVALILLALSNCCQ